MGASGKHNPDNVLLGIHATPELKAMVSIIAEKSGRSITDIIVEGIQIMAVRTGVSYVNGEENGVAIKPEYRDLITRKAARVRADKKKRREMGNHKRTGEVSSPQ